MKYKNTLFTLLIMILGISQFSCGTTQTSVVKNEKRLILNEQIKHFNFKFNANYAYPQSYQSVYLSSDYDVKVSPDTVQAYLPYYGRAYTAPMDPSEGGIKFVSTNFDYEIEEGKKKGNWLITIRTQDTRRPYVLYFDLWDSGAAHLNVHDRDRQAISFQGDVEVQKKPE